MQQCFYILSLLISLGTPTLLASQDNVVIDEISLERTLCLGTCPAYKVIIRSDGTVKYTGHAYVNRKGEHEGTINHYYFNQLTKLIQGQHFLNMESFYSEPMTDMPSAIVSIAYNGKQKTVNNYADAGPIALWGIEMAIDAAVTHVNWDSSE